MFFDTICKIKGTSEMLDSTDEKHLHKEVIKMQIVYQRQNNCAALITN